MMPANFVVSVIGYKEGDLGRAPVIESMLVDFYVYRPIAHAILFEMASRLFSQENPGYSQVEFKLHLMNGDGHKKEAIQRWLEPGDGPEIYHKDFTGRILEAGVIL